MAAKRIRFRSDAREKILHGAAALADAVRVTLGPKARCVLIERKWGKPIAFDDGAAVKAPGFGDRRKAVLEDLSQQEIGPCRSKTS